VAIYIVTGKLGSGKTLAAVGRIRDYLRQGRRVATNLNLRLEGLLGAQDRSARVLRISDKPTADELEALGLGADELDEDRYGLLVLDELGSWLNARQWSDKGRQAVIDWLIHSRKKRWDVVFIVQHVSMIDKQIREALLEFLVTCKRLDRIRVPLLGPLGKLLTFGLWDGNLPKLHLGLVMYAGGSATLQGALVSDRWLYRGRDLYAAYETEQVFAEVPSAAVVGKGGVVVCGTWSFLTPWHVVGRHLRFSSLADVLRFQWRLFVWSCGFGDHPTPRGRPAARLGALVRIPDPELRWFTARVLVNRGVL